MRNRLNTGASGDDVFDLSASVLRGRLSVWFFLCSPKAALPPDEYRLRWLAFNFQKPALAEIVLPDGGLLATSGRHINNQREVTC